jgi:hypothetical protein
MFQGRRAFKGRMGSTYIDFRAHPTSFSSNIAAFNISKEGEIIKEIKK